MAENMQEKTFSFKVKRIHGTDIETIKKAINEYVIGYNLCSNELNSVLTNKVSELYQCIPEDCRDNKYAQLLICDEWKDKPIYKFINDNGKRQEVIDGEVKVVACKHHIDNALKKFFFNKIKDYGNNNSLDIPSSYFRDGFILNVISNYRTKLKQFNKLKIKRKDVDSNSDIDTLLEQCICDMCYYGIEKGSDFDNIIKNKVSIDGSNEKDIDRLKILYDCYKSHAKEISEKMEALMAETLKNMGGCERKTFNSMKIQWGRSSKKQLKVQRIGQYGYTFTFGKCFSVDVYGRKDIIKGDNVLVDITDDKVITEHTVIKIQGNDLYINLQCKVPYQTKTEYVKDIDDNKKVGCDINTKHMFLQFDESVKVDSLKGYINIYKELIEDDDFKILSNSDEYKEYEDMSKFVSFFPVEAHWLRQRGSLTYEGRMEKIFSNVLDRLYTQAVKENDYKNTFYFGCIRKIRQQLLAKYKITTLYNEKQSKYTFDVFQRFGKENNEQAQEYIKSHPFSKELCAEKMLGKMRDIESKIIGCRNNILQYTYSLFGVNGYGSIALENLTSSSIKKRKKAKIPNRETLLGSMGFMGMTKEEVNNHRKSYLFKSEKGKPYFVLEYNDEGKVIDAHLTDYGKKTKDNNDFCNMEIKSLRFADVKNYFVTLQNNGKMSVGFVLSEYTSQMDSVEHKLYFDKKKKPVKKEIIRPTQEYHKNTKLADVNAANNIRYFTLKDSNFADFIKIERGNYGQPSFKPTKSASSFVDKIRKSKAYHIV